MNLNEFSIACKLINLKLRGFEIPKQLPPILLASLSAVGGTPTRTPTGGMSPMTNDPLVTLNRSIVGPPIIPPQPQILPQAIVPPIMSSHIPSLHQQQQQQPLIQSMQPLIPMGGGISGVGIVKPLIDTSPIIAIEQNIVLPAGPTPPQSGTPTRAPSIESP